MTIQFSDNDRPNVYLVFKSFSLCYKKNMFPCVVHHWPVYAYVQFFYSAQSYQIGGQKEENLPVPHRLDQLMRPSQTQYCLDSTNQYKA